MVYSGPQYPSRNTIFINYVSDNPVPQGEMGRPMFRECGWRGDSLQLSAVGDGGKGNKLELEEAKPWAVWTGAMEAQSSVVALQRPPQKVGLRGAQDKCLGKA